MAAKKTASTPAKAAPARGAASSSGGGLRGKVTAAASAAQPELAPALQAASSAHNKVFGPKGRLTASSASRWVLVEFLVCFVILGLGTIVAPDGRKNGGAAHIAVKGSALALLFFILALMSGGGPKAKKAAEGLGALVAIAYVFTSQDAASLVTWIGTWFKKPASGAGGAGAGIGDLGGAAGTAGAGIGDLGAAAAAGSGIGNLGAAQ